MPGLFPLTVPSGEIVVSYGGGVNSVTLLCYLIKLGVRVRAILMSNPGSEWPATIRYRDEVMQPYLRQHDYPEIIEMTRIEEGQFRKDAWRLETLRDECLRIKALPSIAYGWKKCSLKYKAQVQQWWVERQAWAQEEWAAGRKLIRVIGYDAGEPERAFPNFLDKREAARYQPWYPLFDAGIDRRECELMIVQDFGLPLPPKSACTFCPSNRPEEWIKLRDHEPEKFAEAVEMSRNAQIDVPEVVGLMRCNPKGKRQLHEWADGKYEIALTDADDETDELPCECKL